MKKGIYIFSPEFRIYFPRSTTTKRVRKINEVLNSFGVNSGPKHLKCKHQRNASLLWKIYYYFISLNVSLKKKINLAVILLTMREFANDQKLALSTRHTHTHRKNVCSETRIKFASHFTNINVYDSKSERNSFKNSNIALNKTELKYPHNFQSRFSFLLFSTFEYMSNVENGKHFMILCTYSYA